jgi:hypothetical protein
MRGGRRGASWVARFQLGGCFADEGGDGGGEVEGAGEGLGAGGHFAPSFADNIDELFAWVIGVLGGEGADFVFEENQAGGVFEGLGAGVGFQAGFRDPGGDFGGFVFGDAGFEEEGAGAIGLFRVEGFAPGEIADLAFGKGGAGNGPAFEVLAAGGEAEEGRGIGGDADDPGFQCGRRRRARRGGRRACGWGRRRGLDR